MPCLFGYNIIPDEMKHYLFRTLLLVALSCASTVYAVTLGQPRVISFLGQPLEVEIDLVGLEPDQQRYLSLRIANERHFERLGVLYTEYLDALTFDVVQSDGRWMARARTKNPVSEPYLEFPLQVSWPGGQLIKRYALLLEPPARAEPTLATGNSRATLGTTQLPAAKSSNSYGPVRRGEILTAVAQKLKPIGTTTWQMSIVLFRANPHAFTDGNINKLRVGSMLAIPGRDVIEKLDNPSAISEFAAETTRWPVSMATSPSIAEASVDDAQRPIVAKKDKSDAHHGAQQGLYEQLLVTMENVETHRITNGSVEARLARMEVQLAGMQTLIEHNDAQIAATELEAAARRAVQAAQTVASLQTSNLPPTANPWYAGYIWVAWVALGLMALLTLLVMRRRSYMLAEHGYVLELPEAGRNGASLRPEVEQTPPIAQVGVAEGGLDRPQEQRAYRTLVEAQADLPEPAEPDIPAFGAAEEGITHAAKAAPRDGIPGREDPPHPKSGHTTEWTPDTSEVEFASWVAELDEDLEQPEEQAAYNDAIELLNDQPDQLDDDIPSFPIELDDPVSAEVPVHAPIPAPIELGSINDTDGDAGLSDHVDPISDIGEDDDFSLSLDLARAYLEIGDQEGAEEILKRALAGAPDPEPRRQMEELLTRIG